jgi:tellurite methyltransferase
MGRGRDLLYFARRGFRVVGVDRAPEGLERARRRAARLGVRLRAYRADLRTYRLPGKVDVVFSSTTFNQLPPGVLSRCLGHFKAATVPHGLHAVNAFVDRPGLAKAPDLDPGVRLFRAGELRRHYAGWRILENRILEFPCRFGGSPHRHAVEFVVAERPDRPLRRTLADRKAPSRGTGSRSTGRAS